MVLLDYFHTAHLFKGNLYHKLLEHALICALDEEIMVAQ